MDSKKEMISNYVLIKLIKNTSEYKLSNGESLLMSNEVTDEDGSVVEYGDMNYMPSAGEVVSVPEKLFFQQGFRDPNYMDWDTDIEIQPGDIVIVRRMAIDKSMGDTLYYFEDGEMYIFIKYESLILAIRNDKKEARSLNGFVIITLLSMDQRSRIVIPSLESQKGAKAGQVVLVGKPNKAYHPTFTANYAPDEDGSGDGNNIQEKDIIIFRPEAWAELEPSIGALFTPEKNKKYYRVQRNRILAKVENL